jgi:tetratricopeptide (TPR) repeat protein
MANSFRDVPDMRLTAPTIRALVAVLATLITLTAIAQAVFPQITTRSQALSSLDHVDARQRAAAVEYIARTGLATDGPLLVKRLSDDNPTVRELAEASVWQVWSRSGDAETDKILAFGVKLMSSGQLKEAIVLFGQVIAKRPGFAEGWNKRATAYFLDGDLEKSLLDCAEVIKRNPQHFGALSGYGQIYFQLEEFDKARDFFRRALAVNPNMSGVEINLRAIDEVLREKRRKMI